MTRIYRPLIAQLFFATSLSAIAGAAAADAAPGSAEISELGRLNGVSLACSQPALTARAREILIALAPKEREIGEIYERATSDAFLAQGQQSLPCPEGKALAGQIDVAEAALKRVFAKKP